MRRRTHYLETRRRLHEDPRQMRSHETIDHQTNSIYEVSPIDSVSNISQPSNAIYKSINVAEEGIHLYSTRSNRNNTYFIETNRNNEAAYTNPLSASEGLNRNSPLPFIPTRVPSAPSSVNSHKHGLKNIRRYKPLDVTLSGCPKLHSSIQDFKKVNLPFVKQTEPVDKFIDRLIEGEETALPNDSRVVSASSALHHEFESKNLPAIELVQFSGDSSTWPEFIENFSRRIHFKLSFSDNDRMERLLSVLVGEAKKTVECIGTSGIFYASALKLLKRDFGNPTVVTHLKLKQLFDLPQILQGDRSAIRRYHQHLKSTITWLKVMGYHSALTSTDNLSKAVMRLPHNLRNSFYKHSRNFLSSEISSNPDLSFFENWLDDKLREYYNPIANIIASKEQNLKSSGKGSSYNTTAKPQNDEVTYDSSILACWMCSKPHKIWNCDAFNSKTVEDRRSSAKDLKLCYNCLSNNHQIKTCQSRLSCKVCNGRHHTLLHVNKGEDTKHSKIGYGSTHHTTEEERVFLQVIPVTISHGEIRIETNALLDCGSDTTLIKRNLSEKLNLQGKSRHLEISNVLEERKVVKSKVVNFDLSSVFHPDSVLVENAWVVEELNVEPHSVNLVDIKDKFDHLKLLPISYPIDKEVGILIKK